MKKLNNKKKKVIAGIVGGIGGLILAVLISDLGGYVEVQRYIKEDRQPHKNNFISQENELEINLKDYERKIAYHTQKSEVSMDGVIGNPLYFGQLTSDYKSIIVLVKDLAPSKLEEYLNMEISEEEAVLFEKELVEKIKASKKLSLFGYQR